MILIFNIDYFDNEHSEIVKNLNEAGIDWRTMLNYNPNLFNLNIEEISFFNQFKFAIESTLSFYTNKSLTYVEEITNKTVYDFIKIISCLKFLIHFKIETAIKNKIINYSIRLKKIKSLSASDTFFIEIIKQ